jgi:exopolyphosphatase/guanosine-5'-triphosphate,3'-diphosphate pyrophosphatase
VAPSRPRRRRRAEGVAPPPAWLLFSSTSGNMPARMKVAAIDVGSNSIHMVVARIGRSGFEIIDRAKEMVGLGRSTLSTGSLSPTAIDIGFRTLETFKRLAEEHHADPILAVATSAVREARNGGEFALRVWDRLGLHIDVVTGAEEARLIFLAAAHAIDFRGERPIVIDIGGGSLEVIAGDGNRIRWVESLKLGVVRLTERFLRSDPPGLREVAALRSHLARTLAPVFRRVRRLRPTLLVGTSGTLLNLTSMAAALQTGRAPERVHNRVLRSRGLGVVRELTLALGSSERAKLAGLDRRRVDLIPAGAVLTSELFEGFGLGELRACDWALREGILLDFMARHADEVAAAERVPDLRRRSVLLLADRLRSDDAHGRHVAKLALQLFDGARRFHGLGRRERELLEFAALLHDVGLYVNHAKHHRHSHYLITHGELRGFAPEEIAVIAAVARFHKGAPPKMSHEELAALSPEARELVLALTAILRVADSFDRSHHGVVRDVRIARRNGALQVRLETGGRDAALELWGAERKADLWEKCFGTDLEFGVASEPKQARR